MVVVCSILLKNTKINGITLFPFVILRSKQDLEDSVLLNHERIHLRQQLELLVVFFYLWYVIEYYYWFYKLKNGPQAYRRISFEREAYAMEHDREYLQKRKLWSFYKFRKI
ncbi:hypothetical protein [Chryseobacterium sp. A301]